MSEWKKEFEIVNNSGELHTLEETQSFGLRR